MKILDCVKGEQRMKKKFIDRYVKVIVQIDDLLVMSRLSSLMEFV